MVACMKVANDGVVMRFTQSQWILTECLLLAYISLQVSSGKVVRRSFSLCLNCLNLSVMRVVFVFQESLLKL